ncbi:hypothetical protein AMTRI_Chr04g244940 [Amborella trichopoda]
MFFRVFLCFFIIAITLYLHNCKNCCEGLANLSHTHFLSLLLVYGFDSH